jgi:photosystem II stability/assembly factor-like uncharacterized protein
MPYWFDDPMLATSDDHGVTWQARPLAGVRSVVTAVWTRGGDAPIFAVSDGGQIFRSLDRGASFTVVASDANVSLHAVWGTAADVLYVVGRASATSPRSGLPDAGEPDDAATDAGTAGLASRVANASGFVLRSTDGGTTWTQVASVGGGGLVGVSGTPDGRRVFAVGPGERWARTDDGARTWRTSTLALEAGDHRFDFHSVLVLPDDPNPYIVQTSYAGGPSLVRDIDDYAGAIVWRSEDLPLERFDESSGTRWASSVWGDSTTNVWAVGTGGALWHRQ